MRTPATQKSGNANISRRDRIQAVEATEDRASADWHDLEGWQDMTNPAQQPSRRIEDFAVIGSTQSAALVHRDGAVEWLCLPRFDSEAIFAALLGGKEHGSCVNGGAKPGQRGWCKTRPLVGRGCSLSRTSERRCAEPLRAQRIAAGGATDVSASPGGWVWGEVERPVDKLGRVYAERISPVSGSICSGLAASLTLAASLRRAVDWARR